MTRITVPTSLVTNQQSKVTPQFDLNAIIRQLQQIPGQQALNVQQRTALDEQIGLGDQISDVFSNIGGGLRAQVEQQFDTAGKNVQGDLQTRGLAGSSLAPLASVEVEGQKQQTLGDLSSRLTQAQTGLLTQLRQSFANNLLGASAQNIDLFNQLLGVGETTEQSTNVDDKGLKTVGGGGGDGGGSSRQDSSREGGGGGGSSSSSQAENPNVPLSCLGLPVNDFVKCMQKKAKGKKAAGGFGGGSGGGGPQTIANPFV